MNTEQMIVAVAEAMVAAGLIESEENDAGNC